MKKCFKCNETKPLFDFYKHSRMLDGHLNKCKECTKKDVFEHRYGPNREKILAYDRQRGFLKHRLEKATQIHKEWKLKHPKRRAAHSKVASAIKSGKLTKLPCFVCGEKAEAHHPDYDRPLDVMWLCSAHHKQAHAIVYKERNK